MLETLAVGSRAFQGIIPPLFSQAHSAVEQKSALRVPSARLIRRRAGVEGQALIRRDRSPGPTPTPPHPKNILSGKVGGQPRGGKRRGCPGKEFGCGRRRSLCGVPPPSPPYLAKVCLGSQHSKSWILGNLASKNAIVVRIKLLCL